MGPVFRLTLGQLTGRWRIIIMTVLAAMPVLITLVVIGADAPSVREFESGILGAMLAGSIAPLVVLAIAGAAFGNEVEDRTLANLTLSPVPRWQIALPKLLATVAIAGPFMAASAFLTAHVAYLGDPRASLAVTVGAVAGVAMYAALFVWLGLRSTQAVGIGLVYIVLWEGFFTGFVAGARLFSIRYYAMGVAHAIDPRRFAFNDILGPTPAVLAALLVLGGCFYLTTRRLRAMDVP